jgi:hypothetical protein
MKATLLKYAVALYALLFLSFFAVAQDGNTPMEVFIAREKLQHSFRPVTGLLRQDLQASLSSVEAYVHKAQFFRLDQAQLKDFMDQNNKGIRLVLPDGDGGSFELDLARFGITAQGFKVNEIGAGGTTVANYTPGLYYRGVVNNIPGSLAAFSFFNNELYGVFSIPGRGNFSITPNTMLGNDKEHYILYNDADLKVLRQSEPCHSDDMKVQRSETGNTAARLTYSNCKDVEVMLLADYATYLSRSSSTTNVANYLTSIFNVMCVLYRNEGIYTSIKVINVNTATDDYQTLGSSSLAFLTKFGQLTQNSMGGADLAHLVSTRYNGALGGVAWLDVLCLGYLGASQHAGPYAFSNIYANENAGTFPTYTWNVECMTHEMGHNLGSPHTHNCIAWTGGPIDGCAPTVNAAYEEDGPCAVGPIPSAAVKGTIMSYCHLLAGVGISFANGFGTQPGDLIRTNVSSGACAANYIPDTVMTVTNTTLNATRECTDATGLTFYWNDNENSDESDNRLVLKLRKGANNIGTLDNAGFAVSTATLAAYGTNAGTSVTFPAGVLNTGTTNVAMNRYWNVTPISQPITTVEVLFPFSQQDISDIGGSIPAVTSHTNLKFYKMGTGVNPNPASGFAGATAGNTATYAYSATTASTTTWTYSTSGNTRFARFLVTSLSGGGGFGSTTTPLPLNVIWFKGTARGNAVSLDWEVANEKGLKEYVIERSANGLDYEPMSIVGSQNLASHVYNTIDKKPYQGNNYYRLSVVNKDGSRQIAAFTHVYLDRGTVLNIYPNPAKDELHIAMTGKAAGAATLQLLDMNGRVVLTTVLHKADNTIDLKSFAKGIYLLRLVNGQEMIHQKLMIQ